jgi:ectoine hydroxylase-related dioxygenase (phytanoyl-CoA dioxygenase family)
MFATKLALLCVVVYQSKAWSGRNVRPVANSALNAIPSLYKEQEKMLVSRGKVEAALMQGVYRPIESENVKGAGSGGGFGGSKRSRKSQLIVEGKAHAETLKISGVVRIDHVLSKDAADELRAFAYALRHESEALVASGEVEPFQRFADVLLKENRCDLTIPLGSRVVADVLCNVLQESPVGYTISNLLGKEAVLYELSCLMSDPGSQRQVVHPDTPYREDDEPVLYTCFIALQDINIDMGATIWIPGTNTRQAHELFKDEDTSLGESAKDRLLRTTPAVVGLLPKGCCAIFDSRTLHCGGSNKSETSRALFYFTFKNPKIGFPGNPGSIRREYISKFTLATLETEMKRYGKGKGSSVLIAEF